MVSSRNSMFKNAFSWVLLCVRRVSCECTYVNYMKVIILTGTMCIALHMLRRNMWNKEYFPLSRACQMDHGFICLCTHLYLLLPMRFSGLWSFLSFKNSTSGSLFLTPLILTSITSLPFASLRFFRETEIHFGKFIRRVDFNNAPSSA